MTRQMLLPFEEIYTLGLTSAQIRGIILGH